MTCSRCGADLGTTGVATVQIRKTGGGLRGQLVRYCRECARALAVATKPRRTKEGQ